MGVRVEVGILKGVSSRWCVDGLVRVTEQLVRIRAPSRYSSLRTVYDFLTLASIVIYQIILDKQLRDYGLKYSGN